MRGTLGRSVCEGGLVSVAGASAVGNEGTVRTGRLDREENVNPASRDRRSCPEPSQFASRKATHLGQQSREATKLAGSPLGRASEHNMHNRPAVKARYRHPKRMTAGGCCFPSGRGGRTPSRVRRSTCRPHRTRRRRRAGQGSQSSGCEGAGHQFCISKTELASVIKAYRSRL